MRRVDGYIASSRDSSGVGRSGDLLGREFVTEGVKDSVALGVCVPFRRWTVDESMTVGELEIIHEWEL